jgi:hypothetical protein
MSLSFKVCIPLSGAAYAAVYGIVRYVDGFGIRHWTKVCRWMPFSKSGGEFNARESSALTVER